MRIYRREQVWRVEFVINQKEEAVYLKNLVFFEDLLWLLTVSCSFCPSDECREAAFIAYFDCPNKIDEFEIILSKLSLED